MSRKNVFLCFNSEKLSLLYRTCSLCSIPGYVRRQALREEFTH